MSLIDTHKKKHVQRRMGNKKFNAKKGLTLAKANEFYGKVTKTLGNSQFRVKLVDSTEVNGNLPGAMKRAKKSDWVSPDDIVLLQVANESVNGKKYYEILSKYSREDILELERLNLLSFKNNNKEESKNDKVGFKFTLDNNDDDNAPIDIMGI
jgi:initiation factor 1A